MIILIFFIIIKKLNTIIVVEKVVDATERAPTSNKKYENMLNYLLILFMYLHIIILILHQLM